MSPLPQNLTASLYETDFYAWTQHQAQLMRQGQWHQVDIVNVIEEIESLGRQQRQELRNRLAILLAHLLKWEYQAEKRSHSWLATIRIQRLDIADLLEDNPSLQPYLVEAFQRAYAKAVQLAIKETNLAKGKFPKASPYDLSKTLSNSFYPGGASDLID
ncbi:MAG: DUF29 domain-containing protein [Cyanobacteria bacterium P01_C01_bin.118]